MHSYWCSPSPRTGFFEPDLLSAITKGATEPAIRKLRRVVVISRLLLQYSNTQKRTGRQSRRQRKEERVRCAPVPQKIVSNRPSVPRKSSENNRFYHDFGS